MKTIYLFFFAALLINTAYAGRIIRAVNNGRWTLSSTWDINRKPNDGDTVLIPANVQVTLDANESLDDLILKVTGTLKLNNGKLNLNSNSRFEIMLQGRLTGSGNNDQVRIGNVFKFRGGIDLPILGPAYADTSTGVSPHGFTGGFALLDFIDRNAVRILTSNEDASIRIYAANQTLYLRFDESLLVPVNIYVMDLNGRILVQRSIQRPSSSMNVQLNSLNRGMYVVHLKDSKGATTTGRIVL